MANNYRDFSQVIRNLKPKEYKWLSEQLESPDEVDVPEDEADFWPGFQVKFRDDNTTIWFYTVEHGNIHNVAAFVHAFLKKFRLREVFVMNWADTCSKPRIEEFGGGAIIISAKDIIVIDAYELAYQTKADLLEELRDE